MFVENPNKSLHPIDRLAVGKMIIYSKTYSFMRGFDLEVFTFAYFRTTTSLFTNALSVTHTKRCTWETCFYTFASFVAALFAATMD